GLVPVAEREPAARAALDALADAMARYSDLDEIVRLAQASPDLAGETWSPAGGGGAGAGVATARGPAVSFPYQGELWLLEGAGAELIPFDPIADSGLPEGAGALVLAGGFPEVFGEQLAANSPLRESVRAFAAGGRPVLAECGGLLYLCASLDGHEMC